MTVLSADQIAAKSYAAGFRGQGLVQAVAHVLAESSGNSAAVSSTDDHGWFQWNAHWHPEGVAVVGTDAEFALAYKITKGGADWHEWSTTTNGGVARVLGQAQVAAAKIGSGVGSTLKALASVVMPLPAGAFTLSQHYGNQNGYDAGGHGGVDYAAPAGTPIYAAFSGTVTLAGPEQGFGNHSIVVRRADGLAATYGHGSALFVKTGDTVQAGQRIGTVGSEGQSTGPHLHFQLNAADGSRVNPESFLTTNGASYAGQGTGTGVAELAGLNLNPLSGVGEAITKGVDTLVADLLVIAVKGVLVLTGGALVVLGCAATARKAQPGR